MARSPETRTGSVRGLCYFPSAKGIASCGCTSGTSNRDARRPRRPASRLPAGIARTLSSCGAQRSCRLSYSTAELAQLIVRAIATDYPGPLLSVAVKASISNRIAFDQALLSARSALERSTRSALRRGFRALARMGQADSLAGLLGGGSRDIQLAVVHALFNFGGQSHLPALEALLSDSDVEIRNTHKRPSAPFVTRHACFRFRKSPGRHPDRRRPIRSHDSCSASCHPRRIPSGLRACCSRRAEPCARSRGRRSAFCRDRPRRPDHRYRRSAGLGASDYRRSGRRLEEFRRRARRARIDAAARGLPGGAAPRAARAHRHGTGRGPRASRRIHDGAAHVVRWIVDRESRWRRRARRAGERVRARSVRYAILPWLD